jgi:hypothetical protein
MPIVNIDITTQKGELFSVNLILSKFELNSEKYYPKGINLNK